MRDSEGRSIEYVRVSITDKCNLRCLYCMPETGVEYMPHDELLNYQEIQRIVACMARLGVHAVRLTGGEPMARRGCLELISMLKQTEGIDGVAMTTNGILLRGRVAEAAAAGLDALNVSIDAVDPAIFRQMTRGGDVGDVLATVREAVDCGLRVKLNAVAVRGLNEGGLCDVAALAREMPVDVRFIELMPVGCGRGLSPVSNDEVKRRLEAAFGPMHCVDERRGLGPAVYYRPEGFMGCVGFISAVSHEFCDNCNRVRLTPEGQLKLCLNHLTGVDLRALVRGGCDDDALTEAIRQAIRNKPRRHGFADAIDDRESRRMHRIGG